MRFPLQLVFPGLSYYHWTLALHTATLCALMNGSTVLSFPVQLVFPALSYYHWALAC